MRVWFLKTSWSSWGELPQRLRNCSRPSQRQPRRWRPGCSGFMSHDGVGMAFVSYVHVPGEKRGCLKQSCSCGFARLQHQTSCWDPLRLPKSRSLETQIGPGLSQNFLQASADFMWFLMEQKLLGDAPSKMERSWVSERFRQNEGLGSVKSLEPPKAARRAATPSCRGRPSGREPCSIGAQSSGCSESAGPKGSKSCAGGDILSGWEDDGRMTGKYRMRQFWLSQQLIVAVDFSSGKLVIVPLRRVCRVNRTKFL